MMKTPAEQIGGTIPAAGASALSHALDVEALGLKQRDALLMVCDLAEVWRAPNGEVYATVPSNGHRENHAISSPQFRSWMIGELASRFRVRGRPASVNANAVGDARIALEARAHVGGLVYEPTLRVGHHGGRVYIDLGGEDWSAIEVGPEAWNIVPTPPVKLMRSRRTAPYLPPSRLGSFAPLRKLLGHLSDDDFVIFVSWGLGALWPFGPYPILALNGEAGSGKSTLARLAQKLTDPVHGDLLQPPTTERENGT
jgi:putative DNA primase/helicase